MAFCKYCGAKLEEGQLCNCDKAVAERMAANRPMSAQVEPHVTPQVEPTAQQQGQPVQQGQQFQQGQQIQQGQPMQQGQQFQQGSDAVKKFWDQLVNLIKNPATAGGEYVYNGTMGYSIVMLVVQAITCGLLGVIQCVVKPLALAMGI